MTEYENTLSQEFLKDTRGEIGGSKDVSLEYKALCRQAAAEGIVLLKNEENVLPIQATSQISVFGRCQYDYFYVGYGSGGDVIAPYKISLMEGLKANPNLSFNEELANIYARWSAANRPDEGTWGNWPTHFEEMHLTEDLVKNAADKSDIGFVVIGRSAGEDRESLLEEGSFYLTKSERQMLDLVTLNFEKVVVILDCGNTIDFSWLDVYGDKISAVVYAWQGGMESGHAVADILSGDVSPSGKLTSTIARKYEDYPSSAYFGNREFNNYVEDIFVGYRYFETFAKKDVLYPFGFGLGYTNFNIETNEVKLIDEKVHLNVKVTNIGNFKGKETIQVYFNAPQGLLGKPAKELIAFKKTGLLQTQQNEVLKFEIPTKLMASYDDAGKTGYMSAWILEAGTYKLFVGNNVRQAEDVGSIHIDELQVCDQPQEAVAVTQEHQFERMVAKENIEGKIEKIMEKVPVRTISLKDRILANLPQEIKLKKNDYKLDDVIAGDIDLETFVAGLTLEELEAISRGVLLWIAPLVLKEMRVYSEE